MASLRGICCIILTEDDEPMYLDVNQDDVRSEVLHVEGNEHLESLMPGRGRLRDVAS
jgi:hypothetical protein